MNPPLRLLSAFPSAHTPQWIVSVPEHDAWAAASPINRCGWMMLLPDWGGCVRLTPASIRRGQNYRAQPLPPRMRPLAYLLMEQVGEMALPDRLCIALCTDSPAGPRRDYAYQQVMHALRANILSTVAQEDIRTPD
jgi:hypothetical protein